MKLDQIIIENLLQPKMSEEEFDKLTRLLQMPTPIKLLWVIYMYSFSYVYPFIKP